MKKPLPFLLVHGAWHGAWCYEPVIPELAAGGHVCIARDLPAHGLNAKFPASFLERPINLAKFSAEPSKVAATTLNDYVTSIEQSIAALKEMGHSKVVLVGHSMGGVPITAVAERNPDDIAHLVYLSAFMPASGVPGVSYITASENMGELVGPQLLADPATVGALRMDHRSTNPDYVRGGKSAFYGDVSDEAYAAVAHLLTPDVPVAPFATPINTTPQRWGSVQRHYIKCLLDCAIRPTLQERFIKEANEFVPHRTTHVYEMMSSHSPFLSQPKELATLLISIARS